ncbi:hypothetical protein MUY35_03000 [Aliiroseovarius sp. S1339]|uniref:hypothetical protein n=1 Tax=Aliiroseovarius sp. S1339 TaxID=2936990 RepID=UPI0020C1661B|nr:hypothetical protein [Aliiroseovarius sp. S1339]MCK8462814.1 hypothetical protein [Aliiroseovarius sp. S1339]
MRLFLSAFSIMAVSLNPIAALAGNEFVTMESVRFEPDGQVVASLSAGNEVQIDADGFVSFEGQALTSDGIATPLTIRIQTAGRAEAPSLEEYAEVTGLVSLTGRTVFNPSIEGVEIEKTIYTLNSNVEQSAGSITITDEPLPAVVGWLIFAGVASFTGVSAAIIITCFENGGTPKVSMNADLTKGRGEVSVICER